MNDCLYVATGPDGIEHAASGVIAWHLPQKNGDTVIPGSAVSVNTGDLMLRHAGTLLEVLDERVFHAEPLEGARAGDDAVRATSARLTDETAWGVTAAARFALACAKHAIEGAPTTTLPNGALLADVVEDATQVLAQASPEQENRLGLLARLAAVRRLRSARKEISDATFAALTTDEATGLDALNDPGWNQIAACSEAVLAALEAVRHVALPRYVRSREETVDEHVEDAPTSSSPIIITPWGPIVLGAEHHSPYEPAWTEARDAAARAREAAHDLGGQVALDAERAFQAELLESVLEDSSLNT